MIKIYSYLLMFTRTEKECTSQYQRGKRKSYLFRCIYGLQENKSRYVSDIVNRCGCSDESEALSTKYS